MIIPTVWENIEAAIIFSSRQQQQVPVLLQVGPALQLPLGHCRNSIHDNKTKRNDVHPLQNKQVRLKEHVYTHTHKHEDIEQSTEDI